MNLDYNSKTEAFILRAPRSEIDVSQFMREHGFDFSAPASTEDIAVLFTKEPFAAAAFAPSYGTPRVKEVLAPILREIEASRADSSGRHFAVPYGKELWPFQKADLAYMLDRKHALVGDEPGLGKTQIAIAYANEIDARRVLCIVPASIRGQWASRIREWTTMKVPVIHVVRNSKDGVNPYANWTIVSYELARTEAIGRALAKGQYDLLVMDEAHYLKTIDSRRTRAIFGGGLHREFEPLAEKADHRIALTGTPLPNRPREAYTLARGLCWDSIDYMSEDSFRTRFNPSKRIEKIDPDTGKKRFIIDERSGRHSELQSRLRATFMTRHLKREVLKQLKLPVYDLIQLEETAAIKQALKAERLLDIDPENLEGADAAILGQVATVRRQMGVAMAPQVADYLEMLVDGGETKMVVFAWHIEVLDILEDRLAAYGVARWRAGRSAQNEKMKQQFINDPSVTFALGNVLTLGTGTDGLQHVAYHGLIAEPDWVPGNNIQCFDRLDRGGQENTVQGDIFVAPGSIAERILASALRKLQTTHKALDGRI